MINNLFSPIDSNTLPCSCHDLERKSNDSSNGGGNSQTTCTFNERTSPNGGGTYILEHISPSSIGDSDKSNNDISLHSSSDIIEETRLDYDWDEENGNEITINALKITYDHFGEFVKRMFNVHQVQPISYKPAVDGPDDATKWQQALFKKDYMR